MLSHTCGLLVTCERRMERRLLPRTVSHNGPGPESNRNEGLPPGPRTGSRLLGQVQGKPQIGTTIAHIVPRCAAPTGLAAIQPSTHHTNLRRRAHEDERWTNEHPSEASTETAHDAHEPKRRTGMDGHDRKTDERKTVEARDGRRLRRDRRRDRLGRPEKNPTAEPRRTDEKEPTGAAEREMRDEHKREGDD